MKAGSLHVSFPTSVNNPELIYSTCSEAKLVFAERNITSTKTLIFKYLHKNNIDVYHEQLQAFVNINSSVNRVTEPAPNQVNISDESCLASLLIL